MCIMKFTYYLLCLYSSFVLLLAYPTDFDMDTYFKVLNAESNLLVTILETDFEAQLLHYKNNISQVSNKTYDEIKNNIELFNQHLIQVQDGASNINVTITGCSESLSFTVEEFYEKYTEECVEGALILGQNVIEVENSKQIIALRKYVEIMDYFNGCMNYTDPDPHVCAGVLESSSIEINRIRPGIEAYPLQAQRELQQQIVALYECARRYTSTASKKWQNEFNNVKMCIIAKINEA